jgi:3-phosphoshikimate 1-carboxyvinyltransferase
MSMSIICVKKTPVLEGVVDAPPSKSYTHRAIIIGCMNRESKINGFLDSEDTRNTIESLKAMGASITEDGGELSLKGFNGHPEFQKDEINVGESGTLLKFALSVASLGTGKVTITGEKTLFGRPNRTIVRPLRDLGVDIETGGPQDQVPITINARGKIDGGDITVSGDVSSQVFSSLLVVLPTAKEDSIIRVEDSNRLVSRPYINMTLKVLEKAGITGIKNNDFESFEIKGGQSFKSLGDFRVPGDYSSAAFPMAAASLVESKITIKNLDVDDEQGDKEIINIINRMGGAIKQRKNSVTIEGPFDLEGIEVDCRDTPDIVPVIAALGTFAKGRTRIFNISHLRYKESDRIQSISDEFIKLGIKIKGYENEIVIKKSEPKKGVGVRLDPHFDHRIAMCLSLIGLKNGQLEIDNAGCIDKSYPDFISHMQSLGADIEVH